MGSILVLCAFPQKNAIKLKSLLVLSNSFCSINYRWHVPPVFDTQLQNKEEGSSYRENPYAETQDAPKVSCSEKKKLRIKNSVQISCFQKSSSRMKYWFSYEYKDLMPVLLTASTAACGSGPDIHSRFLKFWRWQDDYGHEM